MSYLLATDRSSLLQQMNKYRVALLVAAILAIDCSVMGPAIGYGGTWARSIDQEWCWIRPFSWDWQRVDLFVMSLACSQIGLLSTWAFLSYRMRAIRFATWLGGVLLWSVTLLCLHNARFNLVDLALLFGTQSLGVVFGLTMFHLSGYELQSIIESEKGESARRRQYSLTDLLIFFTVVGAVCMLLSWLSALWGFQSFYRYWSDLSTHTWQLMQIGALGVLGCVACWACLAERRVVLRVVFVLAISGLIGWLGVNASFQYQNYVHLSSDIRASAIPAWPVWYTLQTFLQVVVLLVVRSFGYRFTMTRPLHQATAPRARLLRRWVPRGLLLTIIACSLAAVIYFVVAVAPAYRANRQLLRETSHVGRIFNVPHMNQVVMGIHHPLDSTAGDALRRHPIVTHLRVYDLTAGDGTLELLRTLKYLKEIRLSNPNIADEAISQLELDLPSTSIVVYRPNP